MKQTSHFQGDARALPSSLSVTYADRIPDQPGPPAGSAAIHRPWEAASGGMGI
ncbi:MAG: hypothetical protein M1299_09875 [Firmicutes bacterium]|nr:hypothetical protein [Bacillota bacterium]